MSLEYKVKSEYFFPLFADNLFCDLTTKSLKSLDTIKHTKRFQKGVCFFSRGDMPNFIYLLREGKAELLLNDKLNDINIARLIEPDEIFGLTETIVNLPYETGAQTITSCICECIGREDFIRFLQDAPEVCFRLTHLLALNLQKSYRFSSIN
jgi:CRP-like cAMP-binding protein